MSFCTINLIGWDKLKAGCDRVLQYVCHGDHECYLLQMILLTLRTLKFVHFYYGSVQNVKTFKLFSPLTWSTMPWQRILFVGGRGGCSPLCSGYLPTRETATCTHWLLGLAGFNVIVDVVAKETSPCYAWYRVSVVRSLVSYCNTNRNITFFMFCWTCIRV